MKNGAWPVAAGLPAGTSAPVAPLMAKAMTDGAPETMAAFTT